MSEKYESADLILKLYEMRREPTMREARNWFIGFNPDSAQEIVNTVIGEKSAYYRMVTSYWDMAASFVNNGAIDEQMFNDANGEHIVVFAKIEPYLQELRQMFNSPQAMAHLEKLAMRAPNIEERLPAIRERFRKLAAMRQEVATKAQAGA